MSRITFIYVFPLLFLINFILVFLLNFGKENVHSWSNIIYMLQIGYEYMLIMLVLVSKLPIWVWLGWEICCWVLVVRDWDITKKERNEERWGLAFLWLFCLEIYMDSLHYVLTHPAILNQSIRIDLCKKYHVYMYCQYSIQIVTYYNLFLNLLIIFLLNLLDNNKFFYKIMFFF